MNVFLAWLCSDARHLQSLQLLPVPTKLMTYNRLGVFGGFVVEEAVHNLAGRRIYNLENYDDFDPGVIFVMKMSRVGFGGGDGRVCDTAY